VCSSDLPIHRLVGSLITLISFLISAIVYLCAKEIREKIEARDTAGVCRYRIAVFILFALNFMTYVALSMAKLQ